MNQITSFKVLIGSLYKSLTKASIYGKLKLRKLYILDIINEFLYDCPNCINHKITQQLQNLAISIQNSDDNICKYREQRSIYTNIVGCKDCNPNNSPLVVINTAPVINEPEEPIDSIPKPEICKLEIDYDRNLIFRWIELSDFTGCYKGDTPIKFLKIISLPENGALQINDNTAYINQTINLNDLNNSNIFIKYQSFLEEETDSFEIQVSDSSVPPVYSETTTITINVI